MRAAKVYNFFGLKGYVVDAQVVYRTDRYTVARAVLVKDGVPKLAVEGLARRSDLDKSTEVVGGDIALSRALDGLYKRYTRKTHKLHSWYHA